MNTLELSEVADGFDLRGRRALVTGSTSGAGRASARVLALAGARVVACGRTGPDADDLAIALKEIGDEHMVVPGDVSDDDQAEALAEACRTHLGGLDIVVNATGEGGHVSIADLDSAEFHRVIDADLRSAYLVVRHSLGLLSVGSAVVNIGAVDGAQGVVDGAHYAAARAGLVGLTRSLARELGPTGIRVNLVAAGAVEPVAVAAVVAFLASTDSAGITGETIIADGGAS